MSICYPQRQLLIQPQCLLCICIKLRNRESSYPSLSPNHVPIRTSEGTVTALKTKMHRRAFLNRSVCNNNIIYSEKNKPLFLPLHSGGTQEIYIIERGWEDGSSIFLFCFVDGKEDMQKRRETNEVCVHGREIKYASVCVRGTTDKREGDMGEDVLYLKRHTTENNPEVMAMALSFWVISSGKLTVFFGGVFVDN